MYLNHLDLFNNQQILLNKIKIPIIIYLCSYTPIEILKAANLFPFRVIPLKTDITSANTYLDSNYCPFVRGILSWALELESKLKKMYPVIIVNSCDGMRRLYDVWKYYLKSDLIYLLDIPRKKDTYSKELFTENLYSLKDKLENYYEREITNENLELAIKHCNEFRDIIKKLDQMRQDGTANISSYYFSQLVQGGMYYPREDYNQYLKNFINNLLRQKNNTHKIRKNSKVPRILLTGTVLDNLEILKTVEQYGGNVEVMDTCNGLRYWYGKIDENRKDKIAAIADFYLNKISCPRMLDSCAREKKLLEFINGRNIDGIIFYTLKFCDTSLFELPLLRGKMKQQGIPCLYLEGDFSPNVSGQLRTRIQAFMEAIEFG